MKLLTTLFTLVMLFMPFNAQAFNWYKNNNFDQAKMTLNNLISEYESKNLLRMMDYVSESYTTDKSIFEDSIRNEFSDCAFIEMRYYIYKILPDSRNKNILITITYIKRVQNRSTANLTVTNGTSDLIFKKEDGKYLLWKMQPKFMGKNN